MSWTQDVNSQLEDIELKLIDLNIDEHGITQIPNDYLSMVKKFWIILLWGILAPNLFLPLL